MSVKTQYYESNCLQFIRKTPTGNVFFAQGLIHFIYVIARF